MWKRARRLMGVAILATAGLLGVGPVASVASAGAPKLAPPVIREPFTVLPCTGTPSERTTVQQEGCAEHTILTTDAQINALARSIFSALPDAPARRRFVAAQKAWITYRRADCLSASDLFEGGSGAVVLDALCTVDRNRQRRSDLRAFLKQLKPAG
jgi:uncharacterized protein YecT (DUF1311 family)